MWQAVVGRVICGLGGAGMVVIVAVLITGKSTSRKPQYNSYSILDLVPLIEVATWRGYVNLLATSGRSIGGPLGGFLADTVGWRW
jgi:MFS family permease